MFMVASWAIAQFQNSVIDCHNLSGLHTSLPEGIHVCSCCSTSVLHALANVACMLYKQKAQLKYVLCISAFYKLYLLYSGTSSWIFMVRSPMGHV